MLIQPTYGVGKKGSEIYGKKKVLGQGMRKCSDSFYEKGDESGFVG